MRAELGAVDNLSCTEIETSSDHGVTDHTNVLRSPLTVIV